jgi:deoxycytidylate deaminase
MTVVAVKSADRSKSSTSSQEVVREHVANELVFAVVGHVGSGTTTIAEALRAALQSKTLSGGAFDVVTLKASQEIIDWATAKTRPLPPESQKDLTRSEHLQNLGDEMRRDDHAAVARALISRVRLTRAAKQGAAAAPGAAIVPDGTRRAYIIDSIRHPAEVHLLRNVYQNAFTLIGVVCDEHERLSRLTRKYANAGEENARTFMRRDEKAREKNGQRVADAFHLADLFLDNTQPRLLRDGKPNKHWDIPDQLSRIVKLMTHAEIVRPTVGESAMYAAYGAQTRSACLSRQVGAALVDASGNIVATGTNEVPRAGGGVYYEPVKRADCDTDGRCAFRDGEQYCSNTREQNSIIDDVIASIPALAAAADRDDIRKQLRESRIGGLIEFSRAVHAEMDALLSAGRRGAPMAGTSLFVTTFPCHYCARHAVGAGVDEVQYIEPYPKSRALKLHPDSVTVDPAEWKPPSKGGAQVLFRPFTGVAPRMYARAFLKDRDLKNDQTGALEIGEPDWGANWQARKISYAQLEAELSREPS